MGQVISFKPAQARSRIIFGSALMHRLAEHAASVSGYTVADVMGPSRLQDICWIRFAIMAAAREQGMSFPRIARFFGMNHTSIMHGCERADEIAEQYVDFAALLNLLRVEAAR